MTYLGQFTFDSSITMHDVMTLCIWLVTVVIFMTTVRKDVNAIRDWGKRHQHESDRRDSYIAKLGLAGERMAVLIQAIEDRLDRIEDRCEKRHEGRI